MQSRPYKRPESVLVLVYTQGGEVLLLRRVHPADYWQSVTGSLKWQEKPLQGAYRELAEETGLEPSEELLDCGYSNRFPIIAPWKARYAPEDRYNVEHVFRLELPAPIAIQLNLQEHSEYQWLPKEQAAARVSSWTNRDAILRFVG